MKKFFVLVMLGSLLLFTGCFDYVQSLTYEDGTYRVYMKFTVSTLMMKLAETDSEDFFSEFNPEELEGMPENFSMELINTDLDIGYELGMKIHPKTQDSEERRMLPTVSGSKIYIPFILGSQEANFASEMSSDDYDELMMMMALFSSVKCRVMVSKKIIPQIDLAYFEVSGGQHYSIPVFDYGDSLCLEVPFIVMMEENRYNFERIVVIKE